MTISAIISRLREMIASHGLPKTVEIACKAMHRRLRPPVTLQHPFDIRHGVDTSGLILGRKLRSQHVNVRHNKPYWGTAPSLFNALMERWQTTLPAGSRLQDYTFFDVGCGKGRVLMLASEFPFQQVAGVELNGELAQIAERNLAIWITSGHACKNVHAFHADALAYDLPAEPLLIYLFNPFDGALMERFVARIMTCSADRRHSIDVLYVTPDHAECFSDRPEIGFLCSLDIPFSEEDASVDVFKSRQERCNIYRVPAGSEEALS